MDSIAQRIEQVRQRIATAANACQRSPADIQLLAVSKTRPAEDVRAAFEAGQHAFGENYLQDALPKIQALSELPLSWHYIGRIQSNKTRQIAEHFDWVHGVDQLKHARRLSEQRPAGREPLNLCIQVNIADEASKGGIAPGQLQELARAISGLPNIRLRGLMALPPPSDDTAEQHIPFQRLRRLQEQLNTDGLALDTLSMGMSGDLEAAVCEGATIVRIGTAIFGPRAVIKR